MHSTLSRHNDHMAETRSRLVVYLGLFAVQAIGVVVFVWLQLPAFTQVLLHPASSSRLINFQTSRPFWCSSSCRSYWYRFLFVPVPSPRTNRLLSHILLLLERLSWFSVARYLPVFCPGM